MERVKKNVEPEKAIRINFRKEPKIYGGSVGKNRFFIRKLNTFTIGLNPEIRGFVESHEKGSKIILKINVFLPVKVFMGFCLSLLGLCCIIATTQAITTGKFSWGILIPYVGFLVAYGLMWVSVVFGTDQDDVLIVDLLGRDPHIVD